MEMGCARMRSALVIFGTMYFQQRVSMVETTKNNKVWKMGLIVDEMWSQCWTASRSQKFMKRTLGNVSSNKRLCFMMVMIDNGFSHTDTQRYNQNWRRPLAVDDPPVLLWVIASVLTEQQNHYRRRRKLSESGTESVSRDLGHSLWKLADPLQMRVKKR